MKFHKLLTLSLLALSCAAHPLCLPAMANDAPASDKSVASPDTALMAAIGAAAHDSIEKIQNVSSINLKVQLLINLAKAEIRAGDINGSREVLAEARTTPQLPDLFTGDLFVQTFLAGDLDGAMEFIQKVPAKAQIGAFGMLAVKQTKDGNFVGADKTITLIDALYNKTPREHAAQISDPSRQPSFQDAHDSVLFSLVKAFAEKSDIPRALGLTQKISNKGSLSMALAEIAKAQHKVGDQHAADETLRQFKPNVDEFYGKDPQQVAIIESLAFGVSGDTDKAHEIIVSLPLKQSRDLVYSRLSEELARDGDAAHARQMADLSGDPDDFILIAKMQHNAGDDVGARDTFLAAHEALKKQDSMAQIDRLQRVGQIVEGLISVGAFSEAVSMSAEMDTLNRPQHIVSALREEIKRGDMKAVRETAPIAIKVAQTASLFNQKDLTNFAVALNKAGLADDSKSILAMAQKNADNLAGWPRMDAFNAIKDAQIAIGDKNGAAKTDQAIQQETAKFNNEISEASIQNMPQINGVNSGNIAEAIKLIQQARTSNESSEAKKEMLQRALALVGNNGQVLETLMYMSARYSSGLQKLKTADEDIAHHDLTAATTIINSLTGSERDRGLASLAQAQAEAGEMKPAFDTANAITDPSSRVYALTGVLNAGSKKVQ